MDTISNLKRVAARLLYSVHGWSVNEIGRAISVSNSLVRQALKKGNKKEKRDNGKKS